MTSTTPHRSTPARRLALTGLAVLLVAAVTVMVMGSPPEDAAARTPARGAHAPEVLPYGDLLLASEISRAESAVVHAQAQRLEVFAAAVVAAQVAEAERIAAEEAARAAAAAFAAASAAQAPTMGGSWASLRRCESGGNYGAVSANGSYRGAYQFSRSTWNSVAARTRPHLVGVDPAAASPADQDAMALALYRASGSTPWPHCGRHL